ncbi:pyridoxal phosphate-dependent decarboxylase family protein [Pseudorhodoferax sp.]|uniref:pyridoxal phosphate-dependent decarboxylase family protein n=1 Tax=Pseudorhodoferax sp. TaxID=1993553 RepID=UPI002DD6A555|nr:aminotransferase class V-fold PLP-dependent enzyme [Pseudorhodoferax sp.]
MNIPPRHPHRVGAALPAKGRTWAAISADLQEMKAGDPDWKGGRLPALTYFLDEATYEVQGQAYQRFISEPVGFPSSGRMLQEIFSMALPLFAAPEEAGASFTTGGTESVFQAIKTARGRTRDLRNDRYGRFNIVAPETAHPCLDKAAELMDIEVRRVAVDDERRGHAASVQAAMDDRTMMVYASAPCYPFGVFDRIEELGALAQSAGVWLHVDACWGGFLAPFAKKLGRPIPRWDFSVAGVSSISADLHKFGYAPKGASLVMYRDAAVQRYERFEFSNWPRGSYVSPSFLGTKPAGAVASAWSVLQFLGEEGFMGATAKVLEATARLVAGVNAIPGLRCVEPAGECAIVVFESTDAGVDITAVAERLLARGWVRGQMREPRGIHQGVNPAHLESMGDYLRELADATEYVRANRVTGKFNEHTY